jgi:hypothetical protein
VIYWPKQGGISPSYVIFGDMLASRVQLSGTPLRNIGRVTNSVPDLGSGAFLTSGSGMQDGYKIRIRDEQPGSYFRELRNNFLR